MVAQLIFDSGEFLRELSGRRDNLKRCDYVLEQVNSILDGYGLEKIAEVRKARLNSVMVQSGIYNIGVSVPDVRRAGRDGKSLDELIFSCHSDAISMSAADPVGPGVNDNGSGAAVLLHDLEDNLRQLSIMIGSGNDIAVEELPKTNYLFFTGEEGSLKGVGLSGLAAGLAYAFPGAILGQMMLPGLGAVVPAAYSLMLMESMSRSPMFSPGLCGSYSWAMSLDKDEIAKPKALVNFDMVGNYGLSVEGGIKGLLREIFRPNKEIGKRRSDGGREDTSGRPLLKTVVVPYSNISTNPLSWIFPTRHEGLSPFVGEVVYAQGVKSGRLYNVRNNLSLGSSDHASAQQVSDKRGGKLESAMMIGLGGMEKKHEIHTGKDNFVDEGDLGFSCMVAESLVGNFGRKWKDYSPVGHLAELSYAGLFGNGHDRLAVARCYDRERDQWVNMYFRKDASNWRDGAGPDLSSGESELIRLLPEELIDWDLGNDLVKKGMLKNHEGYCKMPSGVARLEFCGREYALLEQDRAKRRWNLARSDAARFLADRQIIPLLAMVVPITSAISGAGLAVAASVPVIPIQAGIILGAAAVSLLAGYEIIKIPLQYSNVVAETIYDLEAERANSQLCRAVPLER